MLKALKKRLKDQRGLTLIELLAVVVILGIIAAIAVPSISGIIQKQRVEAVKADAVMVLNASKLYLAQKEDTQIMDTELVNYIDNVKFTAGYYVDVNATTGQLTLTATGKAGDVVIKFTSATLSEINGPVPTVTGAGTVADPKTITY